MLWVSTLLGKAGNRSGSRLWKTFKSTNGQSVALSHPESCFEGFFEKSFPFVAGVRQQERRWPKRRRALHRRALRDALDAFKTIWAGQRPASPDHLAGFTSIEIREWSWMKLNEDEWSVICIFCIDLWYFLLKWTFLNSGCQKKQGQAVPVSARPKDRHCPPWDGQTFHRTSRQAEYP